jgi:hypothetical protein
MVVVVAVVLVQLETTVPHLQAVMVELVLHLQLQVLQHITLAEGVVVHIVAALSVLVV